MRGPGVLVLPLFIIFMHLLCPAPPFWFYLILHLFLHPFTVSSGRAQGGPALAAFWARVREATGSSSAGPMKTLLATSFARALSELPAEKVRTCWAALAGQGTTSNVKMSLTQLY